MIKMTNSFKTKIIKMIDFIVSKEVIENKDVHYIEIHGTNKDFKHKSIIVIKKLKEDIYYEIKIKNSYYGFIKYKNGVIEYDGYLDDLEYLTEVCNFISIDVIQINNNIRRGESQW